MISITALVVINQLLFQENSIQDIELNFQKFAKSLLYVEICLQLIEIMIEYEHENNSKIRTGRSPNKV